MNHFPSDAARVPNVMATAKAPGRRTGEEGEKKAILDTCSLVLPGFAVAASERGHGLVESRRQGT